MLHKLASLPRDVRDTLFLLAVIGWILLPQAAHLPLWCSGLAALLLLWRGWLALTLRPLPARGWLFGLVLLAVAATFASYRTLLGRDAGVTLIVVLLALKTLELRARRDAFVVFFLGFFTLLAQFFFSQSLLTAVATGIGLLGLLTALVNSQRPVGRPPLADSARLAGRMVLLGTPIMLLLFLLFPRLAPLWGTPADAMAGRSGLSARMQVGQVARLALDDSVALRVRFEGAAPPAEALYWRGPVLSTYDGREWQPLRPTLPAALLPAAQLQVAGAPLRYEVTLEPSNRPWLPVLDAAPAPPQLPTHVPRMTRELQWLADAPLHELVRYQVESYPQFRHGPLQPLAGLQDYLALPAGFNPRTLQLAADLRLALRREQRLPDGAALVAAALARLRTGGYRYTLEPGVFGPHSADEFWFDRREGFCEHIASAFVILLRAAGVPARIVTGYQGGERNALDGFWVVRQSDAHAWAEVWLAGQGWVRVDPTAAVAPARIGALQRLRAPTGVVAAALGTVSPQVALDLRALWDAVNNRWNQWVLNYSQGRQLSLLRALGFEAPDWRDLGYLMAGGLALLSLAGVVWALWERRRHDPWQRLFEAARRRLAPEAQQPGLTPRGLAAALLQRHGAADVHAQAAHRWLLRLEAQRYAPTAGRAGEALVALRREFQQLHWPP
jgi:transglutaminase-like putative cysteine protease